MPATIDLKASAEMAFRTIENLNDGFRVREVCYVAVLEDIFAVGGAPLKKDATSMNCLGEYEIVSGTPFGEELASMLNYYNANPERWSHKHVRVTASDTEARLSHKELDRMIQDFADGRYSL